MSPPLRGMGEECPAILPILLRPKDKGPVTAGDRPPVQTPQTPVIRAKRIGPREAHGSPRPARGPFRLKTPREYDTPYMIGLHPDLWVTEYKAKPFEISPVRAACST
jgi:hypothetical protein